MQFFYQDENSQVHSVQDVSAQKAQWIHLSEPIESEMKELTNRFHFPMDFLTNAFDPDELARHEKRKQKDGTEVSLVLINFPKRVEGEKYQYVTRALSIISVGETMITASEEMPSFLKRIANNAEEDQPTLQDSSQFTLKLVMEIASQYIDCLKEINQLTEHIEEEIIKSSKTEYLINMMHLKKSLVYFRTAIDANHPVIEKLENIEQISENKKRSALLHDVQIETLQAESMAKQTLLLLEHISDMMSSIISNNVNSIMKLLTSITILLTIPTLIGGIWGMNVPVPWENNTNGFWWTNLVIVVAALVTYFWLKKKDFF